MTAIEYVLVMAVIAIVVITGVTMIRSPSPGNTSNRFNPEPLCFVDGKVWHPEGRNGWCYMADKPK